MFLKEVSYAHQGCIYLIKNTVKTVILWNIITIQNNCFLFEYILKMHFIPVMQSWIFSIINPKYFDLETFIYFFSYFLMNRKFNFIWKINIL